MEVKVLGTGCPKCKRLYEVTTEALKKAGLEGVRVEKVEDIKDIVAHGVMVTPALVVDGKVLSQGKVPDVAQIAAWLSGHAATTG